MFRKLLTIAAAVGIALSASSIARADTNLKVGVSAGPYADILRFAADLAAKQGIKAQVIEFTDWTLPNEALNAGDIDLNNFQHLPYLENQVKTRGYNIVPLSKSIIVPFGLYSKKVDKIADIKDGATTAIPNDPSNGARGLQLLEKAGLIKLKPGADITATVADIAENPKHLKIQQLDAAQLPARPRRSRLLRGQPQLRGERGPRPEEGADPRGRQVEVEPRLRRQREEQGQSGDPEVHRHLPVRARQGIRRQEIQRRHPDDLVSFKPLPGLRPPPSAPAAAAAAPFDQV